MMIIMKISMVMTMDNQELPKIKENGNNIVRMYQSKLKLLSLYL